MSAHAAGILVLAAWAFGMIVMAAVLWARYRATPKAEAPDAKSSRETAAEALAEAERSAATAEDAESLHWAHAWECPECTAERGRRVLAEKDAEWLAAEVARLKVAQAAPVDPGTSGYVVTTGTDARPFPGSVTLLAGPTSTIWGPLQDFMCAPPAGETCS